MDESLNSMVDMRTDGRQSPPMILTGELTGRGQEENVQGSPAEKSVL